MFAVIALVCFVLAVFGVSPGDINMIALGLVFIAAHMLFEWTPWRRGPA